MARKKLKKRLIIASIIMAVVAVIVVISVQGSNSQKSTVQADLAYIDNITETVTASGRIQPETKVDISAEISAEIIGLFASEGDQVNRGQPLILLDTIQLKSDVAQARFSLDEISSLTKAARAEYEMDSLEFERQARLFSHQHISETEYINTKLQFENARASYEAMTAQVKNGRARLEKVEDNLAKTRITAPMGGIVAYLNAEVGEIAQAQTSYTQGRVLMTIADLSAFEVDVDVDETEIAKVKIGQPAEIRIDAFRDTSFAGTVVEIGNSARIEGEGTDDYTTNFPVKVRFNETDAGIRPGMSATVEIEVATANNVLLIPYASLVDREFDPDSLAQDGQVDKPNGGSHDAQIKNPGGKYRKKEKIKMSGVFLAQNGTARFVEVTTGLADDYNVVALDGIAPGDTIISGTFKTLRNLKNGDAVIIDEHSRERMNEFESAETAAK